MRTITINEKTYNAKPFDFNLVCDLEDMGFELEEIGKRNMKMIRAYVGLCMETDINTAGYEIEQHLIKGGNLTDALNTFMDEMNESDFFRSLTQREKKETATVPKKTEKKTTAK